MVARGDDDEPVTFAAAYQNSIQQDVVTLRLQRGCAVLMTVGIAWASPYLSQSPLLKRDFMGRTIQGPEGLGASYSGFGVERVRRATVVFHPSPEERDEMSRDLPANDWSIVRPGQDGERERLVEEARGWPVKCLYYYLEVGTGDVHGAMAWGEPRSLDVVTPEGEQITQYFSLIPGHAMPFMPIWRGMAINMTLYFFCSLILVFSAGILARAYRQWVGLCMQCGYNLTGNTSGVCPECGALTRQRPEQFSGSPSHRVASRGSTDKVN